MKQRSAAYPFYSLKDSLDFSERIYKNYGNNFRATREQIAEALNYSAGSLVQKVSSAVQYGLLDLKSKKGYKITDLFVKWYRPISDEDKREALIEAFKNPQLYSDLILTFENNILPPLKPLANILFQKHSISEKACDKAAEIFEENAELIDILNEERILNFGNKTKTEHQDDFIEEEGVPPNDDDDENNQGDYHPPAIITKDEQSKNNSQGNYFDSKPIPHNIPLKNKMPAQLLLPPDVSSSDFDFIVAYIGLIRNQYV